MIQMVGTSSPSSSSSSSSSSSTCLSLGSFVDDTSTKSTTITTIKFLCSYGGKILPRHPDGKLRYVGGETRVLAVDRSVTFSELLAKMGELCGWGGAVSLRCQMPTEDLDALVSITSDEDLANLTEEYDLAGSTIHPPKIRALLHPPPLSKAKPVLSTPRPPVPALTTTTTHRCCVRHASRFSAAGRTGHGTRRVQHHHQHPPHHYQQQLPVHHGNHWQ